MRAQFSAFLIPLFASALVAGLNLDARNIADNRIATSTYARLPIIFEANQGQLPTNELFIARGPGYSLALSADHVSLALQSGGTKKEAHLERDMIAIGIDGGNPECKLQGVDELSTKTNYLIGSDPTKWLTGVRTFSKVKYKDVYPGIDLVFYGTGRELEYDLLVHPGADPNRIRFSIDGETSAKIGKSGALTLTTRVGTIRFRAPSIYQEIAGTKQSIDGQFKFVATRNGQKKLTFVVAPYDHSRTLVIDPILDYSTYLGGSANDWAGGIAVDDAGNAYLTGTTASLDFRVTPNAVFPVHGACNGSCYDAFVAKISTTGKGLEYATYLGGGGDDFGDAIAIDSSGNAYITGTTNSTDFPTTGNALQRSCGGNCFYDDAFVVKLDPTGSSLLYSTYLGGSGEDSGAGIAVRNNNAYVSGFSDSIDFPVTPGAFQTIMQGQGSSFVVQLNVTATAEIFGTFLGEVDLYDAGGAITVDDAGNSYVAGNTLSTNFPHTTGAFQTPFLSGLSNNMYILKLNPTGTALAYSALIGGAGPAGIAVDTSGNAYVVGSAGSFSPVTPGAIDQSCDTGALVLKLNATGSNLLTAAHLCPDRMWPVGVGFDSSQNIIFSGYTDSPDLPTTVGSLRPSKTNLCCFSDAVLGMLKADGSALAYLTYFGGNSSNSPNAMAQDSSGNIYMAGFTSSTNLPIKGGFQKANAGSMDAFLAKFTLPASTLSISPAALQFPTEGLGIASPIIDVTVANVSSSNVTISSAVASGDFLVSSNSCGAELLAGARCVVAVSFKPSLSGKRIGALMITDGIGTQQVSLSGKGVSGPLVAFSSAYQINTAAGVTSPPFPVTITNSGNKTLKITQVSLTNGPAFNFSGPTNCFTPIPPLGTCTIDVIFSGSNGFGQAYATLSFTDNASRSSQSFGLLGNVVGNGLTFINAGLRFGEQSVGTTSAPQQATLINGTTSEVTINSIKSVGNFVQSHTCGATLAAGAYCYVNVSFKPSSMAIKQGSISVTNNSSASPLVLPLLGTGD
ncbi:MAG: putative secreted protein [Candidatus Acidoferrum typicum]|nr:putative secreted protein [Candidatus Acidoferrum typicum]